MRYPSVGNVRPGKYKSLFDFLFGIRTGFGESGTTIHIAYAAATRARRNWILPGLLGLMTLVATLLLGIKGIEMPYLISRIILIDYLIFFFGWVCGWSAASRWRNDREFLEELVITNQRPAIIGNLLFAGYLSVWFRILVLMAVVEIIWCSFTTALNLNLLSRPAMDWLYVIVLGFLPMVVTISLLAWFHLETLRISYWMFAIPSLSQVNLRTRALVNLIITGFYVGILTGIGSAVTGVFSVSGILLFELMGQTGPKAPLDRPTVEFFIGSIPGILIVIFCKRFIVTLYETAFWRIYMLYCWYGAAEKVHPPAYPVSLQQHVQPWINFLQQEEAQIAAGLTKDDAAGAPGGGHSITP